MSHERIRLEIKQLLHLEAASLLEATTLISLVCIAAPLQHFAHNALPVKVLGPVHGLAFLIYVWVAVQTVSAGGWRRSEVARIILVAFIPLAGFSNRGYLRGRAAALEGLVAIP